jgi:5'-nucleotidase
VRTMLTNDDGVRSSGLHALAIELRNRGHDVIVVAPRDDMSGVGAAIGRIRPDQRIDTRPASIPGAPDVRAHFLAGPPGLAVMAACLGAFGPVPDLGVSGINAGPNTGHACLHSGTVGAALTAATFGVSALAVSMAVADPMPWETACALLDEPLDLLSRLPPATVLNLNAPAVTGRAIRGLRWAKLDRFGRVRVALADSGEQWLQMEYRTTDAELDPDCDTALLEQEFATITALEGVAERPRESLEERRPSEPVPEAVVSKVPES